MSKKYRPALGETESSVDTARVLALLSQQRPQQHDVRAHRGRVFECKTCGRRFPTFQALGGHRASHRRPAKSPAPALGGDVDAGRFCQLGLQPMEARRGTARPRVHGCPVCGIEFAVGQALGGHMRRHRAMANADAGAHGVEEATSVEADSAGDECTGGICLDLNLASSENCTKCLARNAEFGAAAKSVQRTLLFGCSL